MSLTLGFSCFLAHHDVIFTDRQRPVVMPVVGAIQAAGFGMGSYQANQFCSPTALYREDPRLTVSLQDSKRDNFTGGPTTTFARAPRRPNPIGFSIVDLLSVESRFLTVGSIDIIDLAPLLDIKPCLSDFDVREHVQPGWYEKAQNKSQIIADKRFAR